MEASMKMKSNHFQHELNILALVSLIILCRAGNRFKTEQIYMCSHDYSNDAEGVHSQMSLGILQPLKTLQMTKRNKIMKRSMRGRRI
jgi:ethanolamine ammonia-lyase small subunit